ncbi:MAG: OsmC family protein [Pseudomonadales bacterium]|jgi:putative redox protein
MKATITWKQDAKFEGESGSGHKIIMDGPEDAGGRNQGVRPMEMLLLGVGTCSAFDVVNILKKSRQDVLSCVTEVDAVRADTVPAVFEKIHMIFRVTGNDLDPAKVKRAVDLSADKYCSASIMLDRAGVEMTHEYVIEEVGTNG